MGVEELNRRSCRKLCLGKWQLPVFLSQLDDLSTSMKCTLRHHPLIYSKCSMKPFSHTVLVLGAGAHKLMAPEIMFLIRGRHCLLYFATMTWFTQRGLPAVTVTTNIHIDNTIP